MIRDIDNRTDHPADRSYTCWNLRAKTCVHAAVFDFPVCTEQSAWLCDRNGIFVLGDPCK